MLPVASYLMDWHENSIDLLTQLLPRKRISSNTYSFNRHNLSSDNPKNIPLHLSLSWLKGTFPIFCPIKLWNTGGMWYLRNEVVIFRKLHNYSFHRFFKEQTVVTLAGHPLMIHNRQNKVGWQGVNTAGGRFKELHCFLNSFTVNNMEVSHPNLIVSVRWWDLTCFIVWQKSIESMYCIILFTLSLRMNTNSSDAFVRQKVRG